MSNLPNDDALPNFDRPIESSATKQSSDPTRETYITWGDAYDFFNGALFSDRLPRCLITLQRHRSFYGFFAGDRFRAADGAEVIDEIALNPAHFHERPVEDSLSTLVHEMAHLARHRLIPPPPSPGYHDKKWAGIMRDVGLMPAAIGEPGKQTGQRVSHTIIPGGRFETACGELLRRGFSIRYVERVSHIVSGGGADENDPAAKAALRRARSAASKTRYSCGHCQPPQLARAKPGANLICGNCNTPMSEARP